MKALLLIALLLPGSASAQDSLQGKCEATLSVCDQAVTAQHNQIIGLQKDVKDLEGAVGEARPAMPWYIYTLLGLVGGAVTTRLITGK